MMNSSIYPLGAQLQHDLGDRDKYLIPDRVYHFPLRWDEIELTPGIYTFPSWAFDTITRMDNKLGRGNYQLIIGLKTTPSFYSIPPSARCSPPTPEHYIDYAKFCEAVVMTYQPEAIELWNEPEFSVVEAGKNCGGYGGFGLDGASYGEMIRRTYDYFKSRGNPTALIAGASFGLVNVDRSLKFLQDAVSAGMQADYYSWHGYFHYSDLVYGQRDFYQALWFGDQAYKILPIPQIISETSITRDTWRPELPAHRNAQADYLRFLLKYMASTPIVSVLWYTLANNIWMHADLVGFDVKYPVYDVWSKP